MKLITKLLDELEGHTRNSYLMKVMRARETKSYLVLMTAMTLRPLAVGRELTKQLT